MTTENSTILVGAALDAPYMAFGDESLADDKDSVAYSYVWFPRCLVDLIEDGLRDVKKRFKIPEDVMIHCSKLMAPHQRGKLGLSFLTTQEVRYVLRDVVTVMNDTQVSVIYAHCSVQDACSALGSEIRLHESGGASHTLPVSATPKALQGFLSGICQPLLPVEKCQIFTAEERSMTRQLFGEGARQAHNSMTMFSDIAAPEGKVYEIQRTTGLAGEHVGFQLADVAAYLFANAFKKRQQHSFYTEQINRIARWQGGTVFGGGVKVPAKGAPT